MITKLAEGLYQSGFPDFEVVVRNKVKLVIYLGKTQCNIPENIKLGEDFSYIWWPFVDGPVPDKRILEGLSNIAVGFLKKGQPILISCAAGINRSNLLACLVMMKFLNIDANKAIEEIRKKNPFALANESYCSWLVEKREKQFKWKVKRFLN